MTNELTVYDRVQDPMAYAQIMGAAMAKSGMFGLSNDQAGIVVAMTCLVEQITPLEFQRTYHIVQGRPSMRADAMLAEFRKLGGRHKVLQRDPSGASVELHAKDGSTGVFSLSWEEAQREDFTVGKDGQVKDNYAYPRKRMQMLWARVISDGVRTLAPEIVAGIYTPEEVEDFDVPAIEPPRPQVTAEEAAEILRGNAENAGFAEHSLDAADEARSENDRCSDLQAARISGLFEQLGTPEEEVKKILRKRDVVFIRGLTVAQADELIEKLQGLAASAKN